MQDAIYKALKEYGTTLRGITKKEIRGFVSEHHNFDGTMLKMEVDRIIKEGRDSKIIVKGHNHCGYRWVGQRTKKLTKKQPTKSTFKMRRSLRRKTAKATAEKQQPIPVVPVVDETPYDEEYECCEQCPERLKKRDVVEVGATLWDKWDTMQFLKVRIESVRFSFVALTDWL